MRSFKFYGIWPQTDIRELRLSFHPIPCGTALSGHVTSGNTLHGRRSSPRVSQLWQVSGSLSLLPTNQPHGGTTLGSCRMELAR